MNTPNYKNMQENPRARKEAQQTKSSQVQKTTLKILYYNQIRAHAEKKQQDTMQHKRKSKLSEIDLEEYAGRLIY